MPSKEAILENVAEYDANELVDYINYGIVTLDELCTETGGEFAADKRKAVEDMLKQLAENEDKDWANFKTLQDLQTFVVSYPNSQHKQEAEQKIETMIKQQAADDQWNSIDSNNIDALEQFVKDFPESAYCTKARSLISNIKANSIDTFDELIKEIISLKTNTNAIYNTICKYLENNKEVRRAELLEKLKLDNNLFSAPVWLELINHDIIEDKDLEYIGIDKTLKKILIKNPPLPRLSDGKLSQLTEIDRKCTEVYFWGIPSSGKTCALGALLSVANNGIIAESMKKVVGCQGYGYMTNLANLFNKKEKYAVLPSGTLLGSYYGMEFDLISKRIKYPIAFIDLAGELLRLMYEDNNKKLVDPAEIKVLGSVTGVLRYVGNGNRKVHFFVLEYGGENREYEGLTQQNLLETACEYIEDKDVFDKDTDAIYLLVTKADKIKGDKQEVLIEYINKNYRSFYNGLKEICRVKQINEGRVEIIPFSIGEVYFQYYCKVDDDTASTVIKTILGRIKGTKLGKQWRIFNILKK